MKSLTWAALGVGALLVLGGVAYSVGFFEDPHLTKARTLYMYYCSHCHGVRGEGNGFNADALDALGGPRPRNHADSKERYMADRTNQDLFDAVHDGGRGIGKSPFMPSFGKTLAEEEIWSLVAFMRTLHKNSQPRVDFASLIKTDEQKKRPALDSPPRTAFAERLAEMAPTDEEKESLRSVGRRLFEEKYGCVACHQIPAADGALAGGEVGPHLSRAGFRLQPGYEFKWIKNPQAIKPNTKMPNLGLSDRDAVGIVLFLESLKAEVGTDRGGFGLSPGGPNA